MIVCIMLVGLCVLVVCIMKSRKGGMENNKVVAGAHELVDQSDVSAEAANKKRNSME